MILEYEYKKFKIDYLDLLDLIYKEYYSKYDKETFKGLLCEFELEEQLKQIVYDDYALLEKCYQKRDRNYR